MLEQVKRHWKILQTLHRVDSERRAYSIGGVDDPTHVDGGEATFVSLWRDAVGVSQAEVKTSGLAYVFGRTSKLFCLYDDYCDNYDQSTPPSFESIKKNPVLKAEVHTLIQTIKQSPIEDFQKREMLRMLNRERYRLATLQMEHGYSADPLPSEVALEWRERGGGYVTSMFMKIGNLHHNIPFEKAHEVEDAAYWFGANFQLFDDIIDIGSDLADSRQSAFRSVLWEKRDEWANVTDYLSDAKTLRVPSTTISKLAPQTFDRLQEERRKYHKKIPSTSNYELMKFYADPDTFFDMAFWFERCFAIRVRENLSLLKIAFNLIKNQ